ncbi:MAG: Arc family DNA-binding protein [Verrucomicrobiaceae bacterium]|nr:MAG: Arc family DNA-binding protein [Verrucomicrobiaceae bacterium]
MATLTIRNLPEELHECLKLRAKRNHRSLNQEVIAELSRAGRMETPEEKKDRVEQEILKIDALRARAKGFLTAQEIDEAKRDGRA